MNLVGELVGRVEMVRHFMRREILRIAKCRVRAPVQQRRDRVQVRPPAPPANVHQCGVCVAVIFVMR